MPPKSLASFHQDRVTPRPPFLYFGYCVYVDYIPSYFNNNERAHVPFNLSTSTKTDEADPSACCSFALSFARAPVA